MSARYTLTEPLGRGLRLFRGTCESKDGHQRVVTITRVPGISRNSEFLIRLLAALHAARALNHPNVVELLDIAMTPEGTLFVVTEHVEGCDLKALVARRPRIALAQALHVVIECCKALAYAHSHGVIHRDVSPRTLLLSTTGEVKIGGFGLAMVSSAIESSDPGVVKGEVRIFVT